MNWNPFNWFTSVIQDEPRKAFAAGMVVAREEYIAALQSNSLKIRRQGLKDTLEAIDLADSLADSNPAKAAAIELFKQGLIEERRTVQGLMNSPMPEGRERDEVLAAPFGDVESLETATAALPKPVSRALPNGSTESMSSSERPQPKRGRGRPRKHPKPDSRKVGQGDELLPAPPEDNPE